MAKSAVLRTRGKRPKCSLCLLEIGIVKESQMKKYNTMIAVFGVSSLFALILSILRFPYITSVWQLKCGFCTGIPEGIDSYYLTNFISDFLVWFTVGTIVIFLALLAVGKVTLFERVSEEFPIANQN